MGGEYLGEKMKCKFFIVFFASALCIVFLLYGV